jgi:hypothetical protein
MSRKRPSKATATPEQSEDGEPSNQSIFFFTCMFFYLQFFSTADMGSLAKKSSEATAICVPAQQAVFEQQSENLQHQATLLKAPMLVTQIM